MYLIQLLFSWAMAVWPPTDWNPGTYPYVQYNEEMLTKHFGACGHTCVVRYSLGGYLDEFFAAAEAVKTQKKRIIIDGMCASACAAFADAIRPYVCITSNAMFAFHLARRTPSFPLPRKITSLMGFPPDEYVSFYLTWSYLYPPQSPSVRAWIDSQGGFPVEGFLLMMPDEASRFWQVCGDPPTPRLRPAR